MIYSYKLLIIKQKLIIIFFLSRAVVKRSRLFYWECSSVGIELGVIAVLDVARP